MKPKKKIQIKKKKTGKKPKKVLVKKKITRTIRRITKKAVVKKPTRIYLAKKRENKKPDPQNNFSAQSFFKAKIKVIGIGGGGGSIVSEIGRSLGKATFMIADTDMRAFKRRKGIKYFLFGQELTHGLGTGVNPELGRQAAEAEKEKIGHFFADQDIIIFVASLGGGLGSGATRVFAEATKDFNGITLGIFTLPFKFEGANKYKIATKALKDLRRVLNVSITIPNEKIFKVIDQNTAITDAFSMVNKSLIESLESLIDLIYTPGIINIDFADLRAILNGKGNLAFLNTAEASGKNRAQDISEKILHNALYQNNNFTSEKILFNIEGGTNLSMFEVDKISRVISEKNPKAKIIFGISKNTKLKNKIKTTLLMTGQGPDPRVDAPAPEIKKVVAVKVEKKIPAKPKAVKKVKKKAAVKKEAKQQEVPLGSPVPVFSNPLPAEAVIKKLEAVAAAEKPNKPIRRTALEIKKAQELEETKQSLQEKEWEIPAFLRLKK